MNETLKSDFGRICEMAYQAKTIEEASVALFYLYQLCAALGFDNEGVTVRDCDTNKRLPALHEAIWHGVASALYGSKIQIAAFRPVPVYSYRGRLIKVELRDIEHGTRLSVELDFNLGSLLEKTERNRSIALELKRSRCFKRGGF